MFINVFHRDGMSHFLPAPLRALKNGRPSTHRQCKYYVVFIIQINADGISCWRATARLVILALN
jgi:hypothetical protein